MLDNPQITAAMDGHHFYKVLGLLLGAGENLVPKMLGPEVMQHVIGAAVLFASLCLGFVPDRRGLHVIDGLAKSQDQGHEDRHGQESQDDERPRLQIAEEVENQPALGVEHQDIAPPDQIGVNESDHQEPEDVPIIDSAYFDPTLLGPLIHQYQPRAKEHGEDRRHLGFENHVIAKPDTAIEPLKAAAAERIVIGGLWPSKSDDIHRQDAQKRKAPQHVHGKVSLSRRDRLNARQLHTALVIACSQRANVWQLGLGARLGVQHGRFEFRPRGLNVKRHGTSLKRFGLSRQIDPLRPSNLTPNELQLNSPCLREA